MPIPAWGVDQRLASQLGCDLDSVKMQGERYMKQSRDAGGDGYVVPSVGDTGCEVLAKLGRPDDAESVSTEQGSALNFWYRTGSDDPRIISPLGRLKMHLVVLRVSDDTDSTRAVVASVVW